MSQSSTAAHAVTFFHRPLQPRYFVWVCPLCALIKRYNEWVAYSEVRDHLAQHRNEWEKKEVVCPRCEQVSTVFSN